MIDKAQSRTDAIRPAGGESDGDRLAAEAALAATATEQPQAPFAAAFEPQGPAQPVAAEARADTSGGDESQDALVTVAELRDLVPDGPSGASDPRNPIATVTDDALTDDAGGPLHGRSHGATGDFVPHALLPEDAASDAARAVSAVADAGRPSSDGAAHAAVQVAESFALKPVAVAVPSEAPSTCAAPALEAGTVGVTKDAVAAFGAQLLASGGAQITAQSDTSLIHLDQFRSDLRFSGIDGHGVSVVVIDTGIDLNHSFFGPDANHDNIADRIVFQYDFSGNDDPNASDTNGHGSNVASIIGSQDATYTGMAPGCNIIALKVFPDGSGSASTTDIQQALDWVVANRAAYNVVSVNMSLGYGDNWNVPTAAASFSGDFATLAGNNCAVVVASGNSYFQYKTQGVSSPSADPSAWSVGAVWDRNAGGFQWSGGAIDYTTGPDQITSFSQRSTTMSTIFAPGGQITGANWDGGLSTYSGTSQATPHIAGLVADMQQLAVQVSGHLLSVSDLKTTMVSSSTTIIDGDDENDNVVNTGAAFHRVDAEAWGVAVLNQLFAGTAGVDTLTGTAADDVIHGQGSNDVLVGAGGNDTLDGGSGNDTMTGGIGNDTYVVDSLGDVVNENANGGTDTVQASISFSLASLANVENLTLTGTASIDATGDGQNNVLTGNSGNNNLTGGGGADTMSGGAGSDTYWVDNPGDVVVEAGVAAGKAVLDWRNVSTGAIELWGMDGATRSSVATPSGAPSLSTDWRIVGDADFNGDGKADLLWRSPVSGQNQIWFMNGTAVQSSAAFTTLTTDWQFAGAADFNGDGKADILLRNTSSGINGVWFMNGATVLAGAYLSISSLSLDWQFAGVGDFNGDAKPDILLRNTAVGATAVWFMNGTTVTSGVVLSLPAVSASMVAAAVADFTGDGKPDIVWRNAATGATELWTMNGVTRTAVQALSPQAADANWQPMSAHAQPAGASSAATTSSADVDTVHSALASYTLPAGVENLILDPGALNGTGNADANVITGNAGDNQLDGGGGADTLIGGGGADVLIGGGGDDTYVVDNAGVTITESPGGGTDTILSSITCSLAALPDVENLTLTGSANIDGTGNTGVNVITGNSGANHLDGGGGADTLIGGGGDDTYVAGNAGVTVTEAPGGGTDSVLSSITYSLAALPDVENLTLAGSGSIDGTGNAQANVITGNAGDNVLNGGPGADTLIGNGGNDTFWVDDPGDTVTAGGSGAASASSSAAANLLWHNTATGAISAWALQAGVQIGTAGFSGMASPWAIADTGDFNHDSKTDLLWRNQSTGDLQIWLMDGTTLTGQVTPYPAIPLAWQIAGTGDFNGDVNSDILWRNTSTGDLLVWFMNGATFGGSFAYISQSIPLNWQVVGAGDFNGDSKTDILWHNNTTGDTLAWFMNGSTYTGFAYLTPQTEPTSWSVLGTGDLTGDGKTDILWRNGTTGQLEVWTMNGVTRTAVDVLSPQSPGTGWSMESIGSGFVAGGGGGTSGGLDTVHSTLASYTLPADVENLILEPGAGNGIGNSLDNIITGNSTDNVLTGGTGNDTFRFGDLVGNDRITDLNAAGQGADKIDLSGRSTHLTFAQVMADATDNGHDTTIRFDPSNAITIVGKLVTDLQPSHFIL